MDTDQSESIPVTEKTVFILDIDTPTLSLAPLQGMDSWINIDRSDIAYD